MCLCEIIELYFLSAVQFHEVHCDNTECMRTEDPDRKEFVCCMGGIIPLLSVVETRSFAIMLINCRRSRNAMFL